MLTEDFEKNGRISRIRLSSRWLLSKRSANHGVDRHVAMLHYDYEGVPGLEKLKEKWVAEGKSKELLDYLDELIAKRPNDPVKVLYEEE